MSGRLPCTARCPSPSSSRACREPDLLLLDEPFAALDALTRLAMHALAADLDKG